MSFQVPCLIIESAHHRLHRKRHAMKISDTTTRTVTIVLEGREIADIQTICRAYLRASNEWTVDAGRAAKAILKSLEVD
jgi:hypothetical protein